MIGRKDVDDDDSKTGRAGPAKFPPALFADENGMSLKLLPVTTLSSFSSLPGHGWPGFSDKEQAS